MTYGARANRTSIGEASVWEALEVRGFRILHKDWFERELTDFIAKMIDTSIMEDELEGKEIIWDPY